MNKLDRIHQNFTKLPCKQSNGKDFTIVFYPLEQISSIHADKGGTKIILSKKKEDGRENVFNEAESRFLLKYYSYLLRDKNFIQINKSTIVNIDKINRISKVGNAVYIVLNTDVVKVSYSGLKVGQRYISSFFEIFPSTTKTFENQMELYDK